MFVGTLGCIRPCLKKRRGCYLEITKGGDNSKEARTKVGHGPLFSYITEEDPQLSQ